MKSDSMRVKKGLEVSQAGHDTYLLTRANSVLEDMRSSCSIQTVHRPAIGLAASLYTSSFVKLPMIVATKRCQDVKRFEHM
jgi:hypothetical protein